MRRPRPSDGWIRNSFVDRASERRQDGRTAAQGANFIGRLKGVVKEAKMGGQFTLTTGFL